MREKALKCEIKHPDEITQAQRGKWLDALRCCELVSPLLHPDFTAAVATVRSDTMVILATDARDRQAFLPIQMLGFGRAVPVGANWSDYHALIAEPGFDGDLSSVVATSNVRNFSFTGLLNNSMNTTGIGLRFDLNAEPHAFDAIRARSAKRFKQYRRLKNKLARDVGPIELRVADPDPRALEKLIRWKSDQFGRTGRHDVCRPQWAQDLFHILFEDTTSYIRGILVTLHAGDHLVAAEFGPASDTAFHPWLAGYAPELARYSPGNILVHELIRTMPENGLTIYELGSDDAAYKSAFSNKTLPTSSGAVQALISGSAVYRERANLVNANLTSKLWRRWRVIDLSETTILGRLRGLFQATGNVVSRNLV